MIRNETKNASLASHVKFLNSYLSQAFGLMFRKKIVDEGWVFLLSKESYWHVTNLWVFFPIDVLWLDSNKRVLQKKSLVPFYPYASGIAGSKFLVELPRGAAASTEVGDQLSWKDS